LREPFLSAPELALMRALETMVGSRYLICPKVALNDIFYVARPNENVHFFNKFFRKHVDFLLCEPETLQPAIGIELASRASKAEARETDQFMSDLFLSAGLPLVRVPSGESYSEQELTLLFQQAVNKVKETGPLRAAAKTDSVPMCPVCGRMMVLRVRRNGQRSGEKYYGCPDNPHCPGEVDVR
jgi:formate dehydrogenase maturation protein FdhE